MIVEHGGTDAGPRPVVDASTNANPLGPSPAARAAVAGCDLGPYPDPAYAATRQTLAHHNGVDADRVVVGAGATELLHRLVAVVGGPVVTEAACFGEYAAAAHAHGHEVRRVREDCDWARAVRGAGLVVVASPGSPDGRVRPATWMDRVAAAAHDAGARLVVDLAYAPLVDGSVPVPDGAVAVHAPNKAHGCTGLRAGWLEAPAGLATRLREGAVTWLVSAPGAAFLAATATAEAEAWVAGCRPQLRAWRDVLAQGLIELGLRVQPGDAPFLLVEVPDAARRAEALRHRYGVKVRDAASLGRPGWWRVSAQPPEATGLLLAAVTDVASAPRRRPTTRSRP